MRIGINALYLLPGGVGGTEIYLRELLRWLPVVAPQHEYFVLVNRECEHGVLPPGDSLQMVRTGVPARSRPARLLYEQVLLPAQARALRFGVLFNPGFTAPALSPCPCVTTFHDLQHKRHPEYFRWFDRPAWNFFLGLSAHRSRRILAISKATAEDFRHYYPDVASPVDLTPLGARECYFSLRDPSRPPQDFLLYVATLHPHKNHARLVSAFARWRREAGATTRLVLAGMRGFATAAVESAIASCNAKEFITLTGWISEQELQALYRDAAAFVFPSLFEGFGLPVVEAMACGLPCAVSALEPMITHAGEAVLYFDPLDEDAMVSAVGRILADRPLRQRLQTLGPQQARQFRWEDTARLTVKSLEAAAQ